MAEAHPSAVTSLAHSVGSCLLVPGRLRCFSGRAADALEYRGQVFSVTSVPLNGGRRRRRSWAQQRLPRSSFHGHCYLEPGISVALIEQSDRPLYVAISSTGTWSTGSERHPKDDVSGVRRLSPGMLNAFLRRVGRRPTYWSTERCGLSWHRLCRRRCFSIAGPHARGARAVRERHGIGGTKRLKRCIRRRELERSRLSFANVSHELRTPLTSSGSRGEDRGANLTADQPRPDLVLRIPHPAQTPTSLTPRD